MINLEPPLDEKLEILKGWYDATSNALYAWEAFRECLAADRAPPAWLKDYLSRVCERLSDRKQDPGTKAGDFVLRALELKVASGRGRFRERFLWQRENEARIRAVLIAEHETKPDDHEALQRRFEAELDKAGHDLESMKRRTKRNLPDKT